MATALDLITDALVTIGELGQGQTLSAEDGQYCLTRLNALLDTWSTERLSLYTVAKVTGLLVPAQQDYTIGLTAPAPFNVARPALIQTASIIIAGITIPMNVATSKQWSAIKEKALTGVLPTDVYLDQGYPLAGLHVHPIPSGTPILEMYVWNVLAQLAGVSATFDFPPGYYSAVMYNLALEISPGYTKEPNPAIVAMAAQKKAAIQTLNAQILAGSFGESRTLDAPNIGQVSQQ